MKRVEFLSELSARLSRLPDYEIKKTLSFYAEGIDDRMEDGMDEEQAVESLGSIDKIVSEILIDTPLTSLIQTRIKESRSNSKNRTLWIVLAIVGIPFWLPLALSFAVVIIAVYIVVWAVAVSLLAAELALAVSAAAGLAAGLIYAIGTDFAAGLAALGMGLVSAGLFIITIKPLLWLCRQFISLTGVFLIKVKSLFITKQEA